MKPTIKPKFTTTEFIARAKKLHGDKCNYSLVVYTGSKNKIKLICDKGHKYQQQAGKHLHGTGCPKCSNIKKRAMAESWYAERRKETQKN